MVDADLDLVCQIEYISQWFSWGHVLCAKFGEAVTNSPGDIEGFNKFKNW
jgi:hypothetical protein